MAPTPSPKPPSPTPYRGLVEEFEGREGDSQSVGRESVAHPALLPALAGSQAELGNQRRRAGPTLSPRWVERGLVERTFGKCYKSKHESENPRFGKSRRRKAGCP